MNRLNLLAFLLTVLLFTGNDSSYGQEVAGGLRFYSQDQQFTSRTSFTLFDDYKSVEDSVRLDFDFKIYDSERFGYIFRIIEETTANSETPLCHFLCHPEFSEGHNTLFFIQNNKKSGKILLPKDDKKWIPFSLRINRLTERATVICNGSVFTFPVDLPDKLNINVVFGLLLRNNAEVAAFDIRNVRFKSSPKKEYFWPLNEKTGEVAHDQRHGVESEVKNPNWLIQKHFHWNKVYEGKADGMCGIDFDEKTQEIVIVNKDSILYFDVAANKMNSQLYNGQRSFEKNTHFSIINPKNGELISYDFHFLKTDGLQAWSVYQPESQTWTAPQATLEQEENHLHVMFWNNDTTKLIRFGGYAHYKFFNDFRMLDFQSRTWQTLPITGDRIYPRSHAAIGKDPAGGLYYLFGGLGNKEGEQVMGVQNFYDLYSIDFKSLKSKKIWESEDKSLVFIPRSQMLVEPSDSSCYILCNQSDKQDAALCLYKFSLTEPRYEIVSDSLPSNFYSISDNAFLFKNNRLSELYAVVRNTPGIKSESRITLYKLNFPPTPLEVKEGRRSGAHPFLWIILPLVMVLLMVLVVLFFILKKARQRQMKELERSREALKKEAEGLPGGVIPANIPVSLLSEKETNGSPDHEQPINFTRPRVNAIWLIGKFAIFDKKGKNITHLCSSKIKSLFFLIFLSSMFDDGISSDDLSDVLWPGMDKTRTKNNRSVTMNHLRKIFEDLDGISLIHEKRNWKISYDENIYIDLVDLYRKRADTEVNASAVIGLYSLGKLLQDEKISELDRYKGSFESDAVELLISYGNQYFENQEYAVSKEITTIIHRHFDEINEKALQLKLASLTKLRDYNKALHEYDRFCQRFKLLMNIEFTVPFNELTGID